MEDVFSTYGSLQPLVKWLDLSQSRYVSLSLRLRYLDIHSLWGIGYGAEAEAEEVPWYQNDLKE
jgi:hypothetical protein